MRKLVLASLISAMVLGCVIQPALAVPSDEAIKAGCQSAQSILNQVEKADAALRINRGRVYNEVIDLRHECPASFQPYCGDRSGGDYQ